MGHKKRRMLVAQLKTQKNDASVEEFLNSVENEKKRQDSFTVLDIMREVTGEEPSMWGANIIGFGTCRYKYASGRDAEWLVTGFSPRKQPTRIPKWKFDLVRAAIL